MHKQQQGFTLIELITVIVILGALAVIALPRFINLQDEADQAATDGVAGALGAAAAVNLAGRLAGDGGEVTTTTCAAVENALSDALPAAYTISGGSLGAADGDSATCTVDGAGGTSATFTGYYVS